MKSSGHTRPHSEDPALTSARQIGLAFSGVYKKINLYSATHGVYSDALNHFEKLLTSFIDRFGDFRVHVEKDRLLYDGLEIFKGTSEPADLVFILHRDGILWLEFLKGISRWEIDSFLKVLHDHCILNDDAEDDIVTTLWALQLPCIAYDAADIDFGLDDNLRFEELQCRPPDTHQKKNLQDQGADASNDDSTVLGHTDKHEFSSRLTREERKSLEAVIAVEEKLDGSDYVIDVLFYIISTHSQPDDINELLDHIFEAMREALLKLRFGYLRTHLQKLKKQASQLKIQSQSHWSEKHLDAFFLNMSSGSFLNDLLTIQSEVQKIDPEQRKELKKFLSLLNPGAIEPLAHIMVQCRTDKLQYTLLESIIILARKDLRPLEKLVFSGNKIVAGRLVFVLRYLDDERSLKLLFKLLHDESGMVRIQALKAILSRDVFAAREFSVLIDDPDDKIRTLLLGHLGSKKNSQSEMILLNYLRSDRARDLDPDHFIEICRTLGKCGSDRSLPLLKQLLFKWPRLGVLRSRNHYRRKGAVMALKEIDSPKAVKILDRTEKRFFGNFLKTAE